MPSQQFTVEQIIQKLTYPACFRSACIVVIFALLGQCRLAADDELSPEQVEVLETQLFRTELSAERLTSLLTDLENPSTRPAARSELSRTSISHISAIVEFARDCTNLEARQACADVVEALDASYRTRKIGKTLSAWYRTHATEMLPAAWQTFRKDPNNHRSVAVLMSTDPQTVYDWLRQKGERHDPLRFLLLRIREFGQDKFAFDNLAAHSMNAVRLVIRGVYPYPHVRNNRLFGLDIGEVHAVGIHRVVGHVILKRFSAFGRVWPKDFPKHVSLAKVDEHQPIVEKAEVDSRWICICRYASAFKPGEVEAAWLRIDRTTYLSNLGRMKRVEGKLVPAPPSTSFSPFGIVVARPLPTLARVPMVRLSRDQQRIDGGLAPLRWMQPLLSSAYHSRVSSRVVNGAGPIPESVPLVTEILDVGELPDSQHPASEALKHAAAAVKLDPTSESVHSAYLDALRQEVFALRSKPGSVQRARHLLNKYRKYLDRFGRPARRSNQMHQTVITSSALLKQLHEGDLVVLDDELAKAIADMKYILDESLNVSVKDYVRSRDRTFFNAWQGYIVVYRGMLAIGRPAEQRDAWLDDLIKKTAQQVADVVRVKGSTASVQGWLRGNHLRLVVAAASLAIDEGRLERARFLTDHAGKLIQQYGVTDEPERKVTERMLFQMTRQQFLLFDDPSYLAEFDSHFKRPQPPAQSISVRLSAPSDLFTTAPHLRIPYSRPDSGPIGSQIWPLAKTKGRLYVLLHTRPIPRFSYIPLKEDGSPQGKEVIVPGRQFGRTWDTLSQLPPAPLRPASELPFAAKELRITWVRFWRDRLFVGTTQHGLLVFNPADESWAVFGPAQGLPSWSINSFFPINKTTLYCTSLLRVGSNASRDEAHFTMGFPDGKVTLIHRTDRSKKRFYDYRLEAMWKNGDKWSGWSGTGPIADLFDPDPKVNTTDSRTAFRRTYARSDDRLRFASLVAKVGERRFVWWDNRVCEINVDGQILRSWRGWRDEFVSGDLKLAIKKNEDSPFRSPAGIGPPLAAVGKYLAILGGGVTLFDPKTETWYGPMKFSGFSGFGTEAGLWGFSEFGHGTNYATLKDILATATASGDIWTQESYRQGKREFIQQAKPFKQSIYWIREREFDLAHALLKKIDADDPNRPDVLLLLGGLHEANYVKPQSAAEPYFLRLTNHEDHKAVYSGLVRLVDFYQTNKRWQDALSNIDRITTQFKLDSVQARDYARLRKKIARRIADGKN